MANLAINGGTPVRTEPYPSWPTFDDNDLKSFETIYRSGVWGTNGARVPEFEERFAQFQGAKYGVCVNSGTAALCSSRSRQQGSVLVTKSSPRRTPSKRRWSQF